MGCSPALSKALTAFCTLAQIGFACGVIIVTSLDLYSNPSLADAGTIALAEGETKLGIYSPAQLEAAGKAALNSDADALSGEICYISPPFTYYSGNGWSINSNSWCYGAWAWPGVSILLTLLVALFLCVTCDGCCCLGPWIHVVFGACGTVGWAVFGGVYTWQVDKANDQRVPRKSDRTTFLILTWFAFAFYLLMTIIRLAEGATSCCGSKKRFVQQPQVVVMQPGSYYAGPPPADGQFMTAPGTEKMYEKV